MPDDKNAIYSVGTALSPELPVHSSYDMANLRAKPILADRINGRLNSVTKSFMTKVGSSDMDASVIK